MIFAYLYHLSCSSLSSEHISTEDSETETLYQTSSTLQRETKRVDINDANTWNSEELSVLRSGFRAARTQLSGLEVKLRQTERHNAELQEKLDATTAALEVKSKKLSEATKANHRLLHNNFALSKISRSLYFFPSMCMFFSFTLCLCFLLFVYVHVSFFDAMCMCPSFVNVYVCLFLTMCFSFLLLLYL